MHAATRHNVTVILGGVGIVCFQKSPRTGTRNMFVAAKNVPNRFVFIVSVSLNAFYVRVASLSTSFCTTKCGQNGYPIRYAEKVGFC